MSRIQPATCFLCATWTAAMLLAGCAGMRLPDTSVPDIAPQRRARVTGAAAEFEARRDFAEYQAALSCWQRDDAQGCRQALDHLLKRSPEYLEARLLAAEVCLDDGRHQQALAHLAAAKETRPEDPRIHHSMGLTLDAMNQSGKAVAYYKRAMELAPDEEVYAVSYHAATRDPAELNGPPAAPPLTDETGLALATDEPRPVETTEPADQADSAGDEPIGAVAALMGRGTAALKQQSPDEALSYFTEATRLAPDNPQIAISAAVQSLGSNYPELAVELLSPLVDRYPTSARLHQILGTAYYRLGDYRSSQVALQQALSLDKSSALTYFLVGCTLAKLGQQDSAAAHLRQARTLDKRFAATR